jgi:hypothetical protein
MAKNFLLWVKFDKALVGSVKGKMLKFGTNKERNEYVSVMKSTFPSSKFQKIQRI